LPQIFEVYFSVVVTVMLSLRDEKDKNHIAGMVGKVFSYPRWTMQR
jgi:hypothetical protein